MFKGFRIMFWGIFFVTFHINLGPIAILPVFVGYMMVSRGIDHLQEEYASPYFQKARSASMLLTILGVISFLLIWFTQQQSILMSYYPLLFSVLEIYVVYNILEGTIVNLRENGNQAQADGFLSEQRSFTIFMTIYVIGMCIAITFAEATLSFAMIIIGLFLRLWLLVMLGRLKRTYPESGDDMSNPNLPPKGSPEDQNFEDKWIENDYIENNDKEDNSLERLSSRGNGRDDLSIVIDMDTERRELP